MFLCYSLSTKSFSFYLKAYRPNSKQPIYIQGLIVIALQITSLPLIQKSTELSNILSTFGFLFKLQDHRKQYFVHDILSQESKKYIFILQKDSIEKLCCIIYVAITVVVVVNSF